MKLKIDNQDIKYMSLDQIGATLQQIAQELEDRVCEESSYVTRSVINDIGNIVTIIVEAADRLRRFYIPL